MLDDLLRSDEVQAALLAAALLPYSDQYALDLEIEGFTNIAVSLYFEILDHLQTHCSL